MSSLRRFKIKTKIFIIFKALASLSPSLTEFQKIWTNIAKKFYFEWYINFKLSRSPRKNEYNEYLIDTYLPWNINPNVLPQNGEINIKFSGLRNNNNRL